MQSYPLRASLFVLVAWVLGGTSWSAEPAPPDFWAGTAKVEITPAEEIAVIEANGERRELRLRRAK